MAVLFLYKPLTIRNEDKPGTVPRRQKFWFYQNICIKYFNHFGFSSISKQNISVMIFGDSSALTSFLLNPLKKEGTKKVILRSGFQNIIFFSHSDLYSQLFLSHNSGAKILFASLFTNLYHLSPGELRYQNLSGRLPAVGKLSPTLFIILYRTTDRLKIFQWLIYIPLTVVQKWYRSAILACHIRPELSNFHTRPKLTI